MSFKEFFSKISNSPLKKPETSIVWKTRDRRTKQEEIWDSRVVVQLIWSTFDLEVVPFNFILGSFGALGTFCDWGITI